jgi:hypothetical protein
VLVDSTRLETYLEIYDNLYEGVNMSFSVYLLYNMVVLYFHVFLWIFLVLDVDQD